MPKALKIVLITLGSIIALGAILLSLTTIGMSEIRDFKITPVDLSLIDDGEYEGSCTISRFATTLRVSVKSHRIAGVETVKKMSSTLPKDMEAEIIRAVLEQQSLEVDTVSGASVTTKAFLIAVADALKAVPAAR